MSLTEDMIREQTVLYFRTNVQLIDTVQALAVRYSSLWSCDTLRERGLSLRFTYAESKLVLVEAVDYRTSQSLQLDWILFPMGYTTKEALYNRVEGHDHLVVPTLDLLMYVRYSGKMSIGVSPKPSATTE